jgi:tetratricopeptide (TPR) repeat protein
MDTLVPAERRRRPRIPPSATPAPPVTGDPAAARAWLDMQRATLAAVAVHTVDRGWPGHTIQLAATLFGYLDTGGYYPEAITIHACARRAAQRTGDRAGEATALLDLGTVDWRQARYEQATSHFQQSLALFRETDDRAGEAKALAGLADADLRRGSYQQATGQVRRSLALFREIGDRAGEAEALNSLGEVLLATGRFQDARTQHTTALSLATQIADKDQQARAHNGLGQARQHWQQALTLYTEIGAPEAGQVSDQLAAAEGQARSEPEPSRT